MVWKMALTSSGLISPKVPGAFLGLVVAATATAATVGRGVCGESVTAAVSMMSVVCGVDVRMCCDVTVLRESGVVAFCHRLSAGMSGGGATATKLVRKHLEWCSEAITALSRASVLALMGPGLFQLVLSEPGIKFFSWACHFLTHCCTVGRSVMRLCLRRPSFACEGLMGFARGGEMRGGSGAISFRMMAMLTSSESESDEHEDEGDG